MIDKQDLPLFCVSDTLLKTVLGGTATNGARRFCHLPTVAGGETRLELELPMNKLYFGDNLEIMREMGEALELAEEVNAIAIKLTEEK